MESKKGTAAMLEWRERFVGTGIASERDYEQALVCAERLEQAGAINVGEWIELVKLANAALVRVR
ncbi:hypothetical protein F7234_00425 [Pseudomonas putida]|uniref:hypothetical protein n=1 Tax=Pseudomonas TaxID=286 RepID=UPI00125FD8B1|nr:hypothetical protein [Pseudomonas putida]KAB5626887.1 hypothetical protein F7234_00425 [Pseudomonas putida]